MGDEDSILTCFGILISSSFEPHPTSPLLFNPQPNNLPEESIAKACRPPPAYIFWIGSKVTCMKLILVGLDLLHPIVPSPICPRWFSPQEYTVPSSVRAYDVCIPHAIILILTCSSNLTS